ncbi:MAG: hypothetical protein ACFHX7_09405 [Pseudomonadota bacterium]
MPEVREQLRSPQFSLYREFVFKFVMTFNDLNAHGNDADDLASN